MDIKIEQGKGITDAIKKAIEDDGKTIKNNKLSVWKEVMAEVKDANEKDLSQKMYSGGDDVEKIGDSSTWKTDFVVTKGQIIKLAEGTWNNIVKLLTGEDPAQQVVEEEVVEEEVVEEEVVEIPEKVRLKGTISVDDNNPVSRQTVLPPRSNGTEDKSISVYTGEQELDRYLENDPTYQDYVKEMIGYHNQMQEIENVNGVTMSDYDLDRLDNSTFYKYNTAVDYYQYHAFDLLTYQEEMRNWADGPANIEEYTTMEGDTFTNLERITLTNGQHAWKSDQGVFYPDYDGSISTKPVSEDLIPKQTDAVVVEQTDAVVVEQTDAVVVEQTDAVVVEQTDAVVVEQEVIEESQNIVPVADGTTLPIRGFLGQEGSISVYTDDIGLDDYLKKDQTYQQYVKELMEANEYMTSAEKDCDNDPFRLADNPSYPDYDAKLVFYKFYVSKLEAYQNEMKNWQDGTKVESYERQTTGYAYKSWTNLERITLTNGQHAWKSDQGVFYPHYDGKVGFNEVPNNLIPEQYKS